MALVLYFFGNGSLVEGMSLLSSTTKASLTSNGLNRGGRVVNENQQPPFQRRTRVTDELDSTLTAPEPS